MALKTVFWGLVHRKRGGEILICHDRPPLCESVWLSFTRGDQLAQIAVNERAPCVRAATVAFILGYQAYVCKTDLRFARLFRDIKNNVRATPLAFVFYEVKIAGLTRAKRLFCQEQIL